MQLDDRYSVLGIPRPEGPGVCDECEGTGVTAGGSFDDVEFIYCGDCGGSGRDGRSGHLIKDLGDAERRWMAYWG